MEEKKNQFVRAQLIPISGNNDEPNTAKAITVQFNPTSLKVALASTIKENPRSGNSRSAQFVDKSSSNLSVELIFDTTTPPSTAEANALKKRNLTREEASDVRKLTGEIAELFMKTTGEEGDLESPSRCSFLWGAFQFNGVMESFDETLDFFSSTGTPLRSTVSIKLSESRYQFLSKPAKDAERNTPKFASTGSSTGKDVGKDTGTETEESPAPTPPGVSDPSAVDAAADPNGGGSVSRAMKETDKDERDWRNPALFNGIESPRLPNLTAIAVPTRAASKKVSELLSRGTDAVNRVEREVNSTASKVNTVLSESDKAVEGFSKAASAFSFGASTVLGTNIPGAFSASSLSAKVEAFSEITAGNIASGAKTLRRATDTANTATTLAADALGTVGALNGVVENLTELKDPLRAKSVGFD